MDPKDKIAGENDTPDKAGQSSQLDSTKQEALKEAARLGGGDTFLVKTDLEDRDQRESVDNEDGSVSSLANADNPER